MSNAPCKHDVPEPSTCKWCMMALYKDRRYAALWWPNLELPKMEWAYGITTVPARLWTTLAGTIRSLKMSGFVLPRLFIDGNNNADLSHYSNLGLPVTFRDKPVGVVGNWVLSMYELYQRQPQAHYYALFQDDLVVSRNLKAYLECRPLPSNGYGNLYTMQANESVVQGKPWGWHPAALCNEGQPWQTGRGAVALLFTNEGLVTLLQSPALVMKPKAASPDIAKRAIDGGIVNAMNLAGWTEYVHNPSPVQHVGKVSTIGSRPHPTALTFPGEEYDMLNLLHQPPGLGDDVAKALAMVGITKDRVSSWLGKPCNCTERQEKLNQLGRWAKGLLSGTIARSGHYLETLLGENK